ncbi:tRNA (adenosine(37)-N6)-threonylcarbamoyltransferase complex dimerization subunit type 1 TsaB [Fusobacterium sp.]|uniref:tRNA (adenosine(37)-N6)-threonylcarbamoyltransferase complex dimerization subunit type 1 TsaB n=1 Tax=Fusobacterium sp. TaxID=68766 RepID=UPI00396C7714
MLVLAIDTATKIASVSLYDDKAGILGEINLYVKVNHSNIIMTAVDNLFKMTKLSIDDVDRVAVTIGPGSFTGIRIGVSIAKGLVYGTDKKIVGINELDVIAYNAENRNETIVSLIDARKERVYYSIYKYEGKKLVRISDYRDGSLREILDNLEDEHYVFVGDGAIAYRSLIEEKMQDRGVIFSNTGSIPRAAVAARVAIQKNENNLYMLEPFYVNKSQAEREKEKREKLGK